mmetsp:Transcript_13569/g.18793  ORF Transcript_13569/g.18793 Transcript_13569/m.18793 type:complete len:130 (+) Transcript_13569:264-653(+)
MDNVLSLYPFASSHPTQLYYSHYQSNGKVDGVYYEGKISISPFKSLRAFTHSVNYCPCTEIDFALEINNVQLSSHGNFGACAGSAKRFDTSPALTKETKLAYRRNHGFTIRHGPWKRIGALIKYAAPSL